MKKRYLTNYDLNAEGQDYENVISAFKSASDGIRSDYPSAIQVLDKINPYLDANDKIIIMEVANNTSVKLLDSEWKYVKDSVFADC